MNQILIAVLAVACFVLVADLIITHLRQRARSKPLTPEPPLTEEELEGEPKEGVAIEQESPGDKAAPPPRLSGARLSLRECARPRYAARRW
jgi:hypothetical protein